MRYASGAETGNRQVALESGALVEHGGVDHAPRRHRHVIGAQLLEERFRVGTFQAELGERALVEESDGLAAGAMLPRYVGKPVLPAEGILRLRLDPRGREPVRALQPIAKPKRARRSRAARRVASGAALALLGSRLEGHEVVHAHDLAHPLAEELGIGVEGREPADVRLPEIHGRAILDDPLRERAPGAPRGGDASRAEPRAHVVAPHLRRLAEDEVVVGSEALRPVHEQAHLGGLEGGDALDGMAHERLELRPVLGKGAETESLRDAVHTPRLAQGSKPPMRRPATSSLK